MQCKEKKPIIEEVNLEGHCFKERRLFDKQKLRLHCAKLNLSLLRLKNSERLFIHKSLLFSLGVGSLVFVLDKTLFASREDHPVSEVFIIKYKKRGYQLGYFASSLFSHVQQLCFFQVETKKCFSRRMKFISRKVTFLYQHGCKT